jgi:hypothetical protein
MPVRTKSAQTNIETTTRIPRQGLLGYNKDHLMLRVVTREIRVGRSTPDCLFFLGETGGTGNPRFPIPGESEIRVPPGLVLSVGSLSSLAGPTPSPSESASRRPRSPSRAPGPGGRTPRRLQ